MAENGHSNKEAQLDAGGPLSKQLSVQLTNEQFERLYLQPGGVAAKGGLASRVGNPTPLGLISFLLCLTPLSIFLLEWNGSSSASNPALAGAYYFSGGLGLIIAGLLEFVIGNTFPFVVFFSFGGYWLSFAFLVQPLQDVVGAYTDGAASAAYNTGIATWLVCWGVYTFILFLASLRTNLVFVLLFLFLDLGFFLVAALYFAIGKGHSASTISHLLTAGGGCLFACTLCGWYLLAALVFLSTGLPIPIPIFDLAHLWEKRK